jgi:ribonuclease P protein component
VFCVFENMLPKKNRITSAEFKKLGRPTRTENFPRYTLRFYKIDGAEKPKCAVVVSKKIAGSAVERNKIRRKIYTELRKQVLSVPAGIAIVAYAKKVLE